MLISRRSLFGLLAAPAIIRVAELMPIRSVEAPRLVPVLFGGGPSVVVTVHEHGRMIYKATHEGGLIELPFVPSEGAEISISHEWSTLPALNAIGFNPSLFL